MLGRHQIRLLLLTVSLAGECSLADETADQRLTQMRQRAASMEIGFVDDPAVASNVALIDKPLNRYSDQPRGIIDGSFWCWESGGRPVAFQKIEYYDRDDESLRWFYCFASVSRQRIQAKWKVGEAWTATKPGMETQSIPGEPIPSETAFRISLQCKDIAQRFSVRLEDLSTGSGEQLRKLARPIHQFGDPQSDSMGSVFGFASNGTNPDALLIVELDRTSSGKEWKYGWIQMTAGQLTARLHGNVVWTAPYRTPDFNRPSKFESWLFFYESSASQ